MLDTRAAWRAGVVAAVPIMIGYLPIAITFGVIAQQTGVTPWETTFMSMFVFAGASQFMAVQMGAAGAGVLEIVIATFVLNFRHFVMSLSLMERLPSISRRWKWLLSSGITDETFAVASFEARKRELHRFQLAGLILGAYVSWVVGSLGGHWMAQTIPPALSESMSIALYAMFIGLLIPAVRGAWRAAAVAVTSMLLCAAFQAVLDSGWAIVMATVIAAGLGSFWMKGEGD
ncbi:AzlC family ABC transporter permease [Desmospora profundinema]|uniref:4-azaleucine resistance transporter AzlC n=1 Tax=Desmospora profundinema TaxID=1571184 RepID=A0ABU1IN51_9BACL|nr:AzlC family ABC transporter permease [Desmospora profundinema]MDR6226201.1 4-azaleucine resistance transporter AzlC [Desmospora profundinema]